MKVKCLKGFATSNFSTYAGQIIEISDEEVLDDLLNANYVEEVEEVKKTTKKRVVKKDESK